MIKLSAEIKTIEGELGEFTSGVAQSAPGLDDKESLQSVLNSRNKDNPFVGNMRTQTVDNNGYPFWQPYLLKLKRESVGVFCLYFDVLNKGFPRHIQLLDYNKMVEDMYGEYTIDFSFGSSLTIDGIEYSFYNSTMTRYNTEFFYLDGHFKSVASESGADLSSYLYKETVGGWGRIGGSVTLKGVGHGDIIKVSVTAPRWLKKGSEIEVSNPILALNSEDEYVAIAIYDWNKPNAYLVMEGITNGVNLDINSSNIKNINLPLVDRSELDLPSYGIISNKGNIEFNDTSGEIEALYNQGFLNTTTIFNAYIENTLTNNKQRVYTSFVHDLDYDKYDFIAKATLKDDLEEWQYIEKQSMLIQPKTMYELYAYLVQETPSKWTFDVLDDTTKSILESISCETTHLKAGSLWSQWRNLCEACGLHIYKDNGKVKVIYSI